MFSMSHLILEPNWWLMWTKSWPFSQCCFSNVRGLFLKKIIVSIACCTANLKLVSLGKSQKFFPPNFQRRNNQGPKGGGGVPGALEPGALSFYWREPWSFLGSGPQSPKTFCAELGTQHFQVWSFEFPDCIDSWLLPFCVCLCVLTGIKKQNLKRGQYIIQVYAVISVYNDMQQLI